MIGRELFLVLAVFLAAASSVYVPGTPGGDWTLDELVTIKSKLNWVIKNPETALWSLAYKENRKKNKQLHKQIKKLFRFFTKRDNLDSVLPTAAKMVRLSFHDCLKESESGAGCNGCFNFKGVGNVYYINKCNGLKKNFNEEKCEKKEGGLRPDVQNDTDNNNLLWTGLVLEEIYKNPSFGPFTPMSESLYESGKSRADLWAFAGLVTVQLTIENSNQKCRSDDLPALCPLQVNSGFESCKREALVPNFRTGRADCVPSCGEGEPAFCTTAEEIHPDPHGNGNKTAEFFADNFGLDVQEAVALLGAHSLGRTHSTTSMFANIPWTPQGVEDWNNFYYINGVNNTGYRFADPSLLAPDVDVEQCNLKTSGFSGDADGNVVPLKFRVKSEKGTSNHGPFNWQVFSPGCNASRCFELLQTNGSNFAENSCCPWLFFCYQNPDDCPFETENFGMTDNIVAANINMLNVDMGWVLDFQTDADGRPVGCPGLDNQDWLDNKAEFSGEVSCPLNLAPSGLGNDPAGNVRTFFAEFEFYANNPQAWVKTFTRSYDVMLENGVDNSTLTVAPTLWFNATCFDSYSLCVLPPA